MGQAWYELANPGKVLTPQLLFHPKRIEENIQEMIRVAGSPERLRPHVKTYKCREIVRMQLDRGIRSFKCATLAEAQLLGETGVPDVLIAYPLVGPAQGQLLKLRSRFPRTRFSVLIDHEAQLYGWNHPGQAIDLFIDLNVGMHRTGISPEKAVELLERVQESSHHFRGWHVYDGHIHHGDPAERQRAMEAAFAPVEELVTRTGTQGNERVCGGSITFPLHAAYPQRTLSPGTSPLWDYGYSSHFPDLKFSIAAVLISRVVSKPGTDLLCLDCGYKAVAAEMEAAPLHFPQIPDANILNHSEEHLVLQSPSADAYTIGQMVYSFPHHICPTVALHESVGVVRDRQLKERWHIAARKRPY
jgi:D-serine deaminase-like pyridoxal phosphate-dependent protein